MSVISVVVPIYREEELIAELHRRMTGALAQLPAGHDFEVIYVDDGSSDGSLARLVELSRSDPRIKVLGLSRNFGHQLAITAGIDAAAGDAVVVIDGDLQDPPEVILEMVERWKDGYHVVYGKRRSRAGESLFKRVTAAWFYRTLNRLSEMPLPLDTGDFRLMDRAVVDTLRGMREASRYIRGMVTWIGFKQCDVVYDRDARYAGETKYTLSKMVKLASDGVASFSARPLMLAMNFGALVTAVSFLGLVWVVLDRVLHPGRLVEGWASLMVVVLFLSGVQLMSIGVLGSYLGRVFIETKRRPLYVVAERHGFDASHGAGSSAEGCCPHCGR